MRQGEIQTETHRYDQKAEEGNQIFLYILFSKICSENKQNGVNTKRIVGLSTSK